VEINSRLLDSGPTVNTPLPTLLNYSSITPEPPNLRPEVHDVHGRNELVLGILEILLIDTSSKKLS
jgi:hypothetical protein